MSGLLEYCRLMLGEALTAHLFFTCLCLPVVAWDIQVTRCGRVQAPRRKVAHRTRLESLNAQFSALVGRFGRALHISAFSKTRPGAILVACPVRLRSSMLLSYAVPPGPLQPQTDRCLTAAALVRLSDTPGPRAKGYSHVVFLVYFCCSTNTLVASQRKKTKTLGLFMRACRAAGNMITAQPVHSHLSDAKIGGEGWRTAKDYKSVCSRTICHHALQLVHNALGERAGRAATIGLHVERLCEESDGVKRRSWS